MERKNRRPGCRSTGTQLGVDLNRNYDFKWQFDSKGSSPSQCAEVSNFLLKHLVPLHCVCFQDYRGSAPFSEPEARAVRDFFAQFAPAGSGKKTKRKFGGLNVAMNWHSYGQVINVPYSHMASGEPPAEDYEVFKNLAKRFVASNNFKYGQAWAGNGLYTVNGDAADYMYDMHGTYAFSPEVGPFFDFEPFSRGMWPARKDIAPIVNESLAMSGQSVWAADVLPTLGIENSLLKAQLPQDRNDDARTLYVQLAVSNGGVVDSDSPVLVTATFAEGMDDISSAYAAATKPSGRRTLRRRAADDSKCPIPLHAASDRLLNDDLTYLKADTGRALAQDRTAEHFSAAGMNSGAAVERVAVLEDETEASVRSARSRALKQALPGDTLVSHGARELHGPDGLEHPDPRVVRSGGRLVLATTIQGTVHPAGRATVSLPFCLLGKGGTRATLGKCSVRKAVQAAAAAAPGGTASTAPSKVLVFLSDAHTCSVHELDLQVLQSSGTPSSSAALNALPLRTSSGCSHCAALRYAAAHDFALVSGGDTEHWPAGLPAPKAAPAQECGGLWSSPLGVTGGHVLLDGQTVEAAPLLKCARGAADLAGLEGHLEAAAATPLATPTGAPGTDHGATGQDTPKASATPSMAPQATSFPRPSKAMAASQAVVAMSDAYREKLLAEKSADEAAVALGGAAWTVTGILLGVVLVVALMMALPGGDGPAPQQVFDALERTGRPAPSHLAHSGF